MIVIWILRENLLKIVIKIHFKVMKILSLFDGMSCLQIALQKENINVEAYYASEIDKYAIEITKKNFPNTIHIGSVTDINVIDGRIITTNFREGNWSKGNIDLMCGGSPCQDLSIAGKRKGLTGERSGLFYEYVRILKEVKPKYFILENVASMSKEARDTITKELFGIEPVMINASMVSAQNRKRLFWVGKYKEDRYAGLVRCWYEKVEIPQPKDKGILLKDILEDEVDEKYYLTESGVKQIQRNFGSKGKVLNCESGLIEKMTYPSRIDIKSLDIKCPTLTASMGTGGGNVPVIVKNQGNEIIRETEKSHTLMARDYKGFGNQEMSGVLHNYKIRKLTPIECERLQCVPDNYTKLGLECSSECQCSDSNAKQDGKHFQSCYKEISNTQRYKMLGNGFNVDVIRHIIKNINEETV